jgi:large repetitive protein
MSAWWPDRQRLSLYVNGTLVAATYNSSTGTLTPNAALTDGNYSFDLQLTDAAGNESAKSPVLTAAVDTTAPATPAAAPTGYTDNAGSLTSASASNTAATTDDTTPGMYVGIGALIGQRLSCMSTARWWLRPTTAATARSHPMPR